MTKPTVEIQYCAKCRWLARATWYAQEILQTFNDDLAGVYLRPSAVPGAFAIRLNECLIMERSVDGFLEAKRVKQAIRDQVAPERSLGHSDGHASFESSSSGK